MSTYKHKTARSFVLFPTMRRPLRGLDDAILLGLLRATGAVDSRRAGVPPISAVDVSASRLPAQLRALDGELPVAAQVGQEDQAVALAAGSRGLPQ